MRDHGGNLDEAAARFGGAPEDWIDLSTGINRVPYPMPEPSAAAWRNLPGQRARAALIDAARAAYRTGAAILPLAGAQAAIQMMPRLGPPAVARILSPTYNEHAASFVAANWRAEAVAQPEALAGADVAVIVNPNNPDGRTFAPDALLTLAEGVGLLVVDESFADARPELSVAGAAGEGRNLTVLRSFGKFYGLAGLRLGFAIGNAAQIEAMATLAGPWPVSGAAMEIGATALLDHRWARAAAQRLATEAARLDGIARRAGWHLVGGTELFRLYDTGDAAHAQEILARGRIWSRRFPWSDGFLRLGIPGPEAEWIRLEETLISRH